MLVGNDNRVLGTYDSQLINCPDRIIATGGWVTKDGPYKIHTFTSDGQLIVKSKGIAQILVVGGGGSSYAVESNPGQIGGTWTYGGGGGGGEVKIMTRTLYTGVYDISIGESGHTSLQGLFIQPTNSKMSLKGIYPIWEPIEARGGKNGTPGNGGDAGNECLGGVHIPYMKNMKIQVGPGEYIVQNIDMYAGTPGGAGAGGGRTISTTKWHPINSYMEKYEYVSGDPMYWPTINGIVHIGDSGPGIMSSINGTNRPYGMGGRGTGGYIVQMGEGSTIQWSGQHYYGTPWGVGSGKGGDAPNLVPGWEAPPQGDWGSVIIRYYWNDLDLWNNVPIP